MINPTCLAYTTLQRLEQPHHEESSHLASPTPDDSQPKSSKLVKKRIKKSKESEMSPDLSGFESSLASISFKPYDKYMPEKHEAAASYADLKWEVEAFYETTFRAALNTDASLRNFERIPHQDKAQHVEGINKILTNLKEV
ncbi:hypothetical protein Tco_0085659 [Tanacetum coccineum]